MFLGEYEYKVDHKGRIPFPPKFREQLGEGMVMSRGLEKCVDVYPWTEWEHMSAEVSASPSSRRGARRLDRLTFGTAFFVDLDGHGRVAIPLPLRRHAEIREVAVVAGVNKLVEIWSKQSWEVERDRMACEARRMSEEAKLRRETDSTNGRRTRR